MIYLFVVSLAWAFSFGLIKGVLTGVDSNFVSFARMFISFLVFLPFIRFKKISLKVGWKLALAGVIQFGIMYIAYIASFKYLKAYEVALFTIFTPIYVTLINDAITKKLSILHLAAALVTVAGTWIVERQQLQTPGIWTGFLLVQVSNLAFAFGQIYYRKLMAENPQLRNREVFGILYLGAVLVTAAATAIFTPLASISLTMQQAWTLVYLGAFASGVCFFLWNVGARKVNAGTLAIFNDLKIPLAIAVSLLVFGEKTDLPALLIGGAIILLALFMNERLEKKQETY